MLPVSSSRSNLVKVTSYPGRQYTKTELNGVEVRGIWWQIPYFTPVRGNELLDTSVTVYAGVIHDDHTSSCWKGVAMRQQLIQYSSKESFVIELAFTNSCAGQITIDCIRRKNTSGMLTPSIRMIASWLTNWCIRSMTSARSLIEKSLVNEDKLLGSQTK